MLLLLVRILRHVYYELLCNQMKNHWYPQILTNYFQSKASGIFLLKGWLEEMEADEIE